MNESPYPIPDFEKPPVVELILDVQFEPLLELRSPQLGLLWSEFRSRYPKVEEHPSLPPMAEFPDEPGLVAPQIQFELITTPPASRLWFVDESESEVIQVQRDRFIHNWRKREGGLVYPHYDQVRGTFQQELELFQRFVEGEGLGNLTPTLCSVTYDNHIVSGEGWQRHGQLHEVVTAWDLTTATPSMPEPESVRVETRYAIPSGRGGAPSGRLLINVQPAFRNSDRKPIFVLTVSAQGKPDGPGIEGIIRFLNIGHEWAARGFSSATSPRMHQIWGRRDARSRAAGTGAQ